MSPQGGRGGGQKLPILLSKKTTKKGGGGQKLSILRRHSLWMAPNDMPNKRRKTVRCAESSYGFTIVHTVHGTTTD